jgi:hypothetical protein
VESNNHNNNFCFIIVSDDDDDDYDDDNYGQSGPSGAQETRQVAEQPASQELEYSPILEVNSLDFTAAGSSGEVFLSRAAMGKT